jgi:chromosome segregation ATPase
MKKTDPKRRERNKRYRTGLEERGIKAFQVVAPEKAKGLFRRAAELMTRDNDPMEPRQAMRLVGGANEPESGDGTLALLAELDAARSRVAAVEFDAEKRRAEIEEQAKARERVLQAERDEARAAEGTEREKVATIALEAQEAARAAQEAKKRATEALERAEKAETAIRQAKALPGIKGRLVRWLAGDVLPD